MRLLTISRLNNLTLTSIHIGAGINIAQLSPVPAHYAQYYLNDTYYSDPPVGRLAYPVPGTPYVFNGGLNCTFPLQLQPHFDPTILTITQSTPPPTSPHSGSP